jgi:mannose-6-phosphate isomerase-like protein (cupin superfamily)
MSDSRVFPLVDDRNRPWWSDIGSAGNFQISPETDFRGGFDEDGVRWVMGRFDPHYHEADEYWLIHKGRGRVKIGDDIYEFKAGDIVCIERGTVHDIVGLYETVEGFWFITSAAAGLADHLWRTPEDEYGHVIPVLEDADSETAG